LADTQTRLKVTQSKLPDSQLGLEVEVPSELSQKIYDQVVNKFMRTLDMPGFRKGKVPRQVVMQRIGMKQIKSAAVEELVQTSFEKAIAQESIPALGNFKLQSDFEDMVEVFQPGSSLTFSATVDVSPEAKLSNYTGLEIKAQKVEFDPAKVEAVLQKQQSERATLIPVDDRPAQAGDVVRIDFFGHFQLPEDAQNAEPEEIPGGQGTDFQLELIPGRFVEGFVEGAIAMNVGETKQISVTFPADYMEQNLAGRAALFTLSLKEIKEKELPTLDDDFAQEISEFQSLAELQAFLEKRYQDEAEQQTLTNTESALLQELLKGLQVELPETLIRNEIQFLFNRTLATLESQGLEVNKVLNRELIAQMQERLRPEATLRIKRSLALAEVAKQESLSVESAAVEERFQETLKQFGDRRIDTQKLHQLITDELLEAKVIEWLKERAHIEFTLEPIPPDPAEATLNETPAIETPAIDVQAIDVQAIEVQTADTPIAEISAAETSPAETSPVESSDSEEAPSSAKAKKTATRKPKKPKEE
jgi:trigger factor